MAILIGKASFLCTGICTYSKCLKSECQVLGHIIKQPRESRNSLGHFIHTFFIKWYRLVKVSEIRMIR